MNSPVAMISAPSDMEAGYTFQAVVDGRTYDVVAPEGGLKEGQEFEFPLPSAPVATLVNEEQPVNNDTVAVVTNTISDTVPRGAWRHGLCGGCCKDWCTALCCCACCCTPIVQAQLLTRMRLNFMGEPAESEEQIQNTFWIVVVLFFVTMCGNGVLPAIASVVFFVYSIIYATRLRRAMRQRYQIPTSCCNESCDDCCCAFCCPCCSAMQMARHTHPDIYDCGTIDGIPKQF